jgi:hypothetical protein
MSDETTTVGQMASDYLEYDEESLLLLIGQRASLAPTKPGAAVLPTKDFQVEYPHLGFGDDMVALGKRIARRVAKELHAVVCGDDPDDAEDRAKLRSALQLTDEALAAAVAAVLAGPLGLGGAIAGALAALFVKRLLKPAGEEVCKEWAERLEGL